MIHSDGFRSPGRQECLRLPAKVPVGRVVYTRRALPAVLPVNFTLDTDSSVVLCASAASDLVRAVDGVVVAFEADDFDAGRRSGWSVVVTGRAAVVTDPAEHERLLRTGPARGCRCTTGCSSGSRPRWSRAGNSRGCPSPAEPVARRAPGRSPAAVAVRWTRRCRGCPHGVGGAARRGEPPPVSPAACGAPSGVPYGTACDRLQPREHPGPPRPFRHRRGRAP